MSGVRARGRPLVGEWGNGGICPALLALAIVASACGGSSLREVDLLRGYPSLTDDRERDDRILAVPTSGPMSDAVDLETLESQHTGTMLIIETWFTHYKEPGRLWSAGWAGAAAALTVVREASRYYEQSLGSAPQLLTPNEAP